MYLSLQQAADRLGKTPRQVRYLIRAGVLPGPKMKRRLEIRLAGADALAPERLARGLIAYRGVLAPF